MPGATGTFGASDVLGPGLWTVWRESGARPSRIRTDSRAAGRSQAPGRLPAGSAALTRSIRHDPGDGSPDKARFPDYGPLRGNLALGRAGSGQIPVRWAFDGRCGPAPAPVDVIRQRLAPCTGSGNGSPRAPDRPMARPGAANDPTRPVQNPRTIRPRSRPRQGARSDRGGGGGGSRCRSGGPGGRARAGPAGSPGRP